ncbi:MAG: MFS transporter [Roseiarcus sp.]|jgi:ACS family D-galactonate transporter-like MFS transporter
MANATTPSSPSAGRARTRARFGILALISIGTMINYLDRTVLGIAAPALRTDLAIDAATMGVVFSAFSWTYAAAQIPGGVFLDRFGTKATYFLSVTFWSLFTLLQAFATGVYSLLFYRFGLGVSEAPCFPTNSRIVATWFPQQERATATGIYTVGEYVGLALFGPFLFWLMAAYSWHAPFIVVGVVGIAFGLVWLWLYREPRDHAFVNEAELDHIAEGGGLALHTHDRVPFSWENVGKLLKYRQIWGAGIGQFGGTTTLVFFLTWFPTYLATERHMAWVKVGFFAVLPFIAAAIGVLAGGWVSDKLLKSTSSANIARKAPIIVGLLLASLIISANYVDSDNAVIAILSVAFFGQGMVGLGWTVISDIAPKTLMGLTGGLFNFATNLAGVITPIVIGYIVSATGSFVGALAFIGAMALLGAVSYIFILGDVRRIEIAGES